MRSVLIFLNASHHPTFRNVATLLPLVPIRAILLKCEHLQPPDVFHQSRLCRHHQLVVASAKDFQAKLKTTTQNLPRHATPTSAGRAHGDHSIASSVNRQEYVWSLPVLQRDFLNRRDEGRKIDHH